MFRLEKTSDIRTTMQGHSSKRRVNLLLKLRPVLRWVLRLRSSPKAIAGGLALGTFVAFTPTFGVQIVLTVLLATMCNMNRGAAVIPVWITNPFTIAPIYTFNYWIGVQLVDGPPLAEVSGLFADIGRTMARLEFWDIKDQALAILQISDEVLIPLLLGSCLVGLVCGVIVYFVSYKLLLFYMERVGRRRAQK